MLSACLLSPDLWPMENVRNEERDKRTAQPRMARCDAARATCCSGFFTVRGVLLLYVLCYCNPHYPATHNNGFGSFANWIHTEYWVHFVSSLGSVSMAFAFLLIQIPLHYITSRCHISLRQSCFVWIIQWFVLYYIPLRITPNPYKFQFLFPKIFHLNWVDQPNSNEYYLILYYE